MEWIVPIIIDLLLGVGKDLYKGLAGKLKLFRLKRRLKKNLFEEVLKKYGKCEFYNDLDLYLSTNNVIRDILSNCLSDSIHEYKSRSHIISYYEKLFIDQNPNFTIYEKEISSLIQHCFNAIFMALNDTKSDGNVRIICNIAKELAGEISSQLNQINENIGVLNSKLDKIVNDNSSPVVAKIYLEKYLECLARLFIDKMKSTYFHRNIYSTNSDTKNNNVFDALLSEKHILLLGEAGFGKTYESMNLLHSACSNVGTKEFVPFYLPLYEYGVLYESIIDGLKHKLKPYCEGDSEPIIRSWLSNGQALLILDGIDDILNVDKKYQFIMDSKNVILNYNQSYIFISSRVNRYSGELGSIKEHYLRGLDRKVVDEQLRSENITMKIPEAYYQLFENPLLLNVGKEVLKHTTHREIYNRSILFEELILMLCGEWDRRKGLTPLNDISYTDILDILGSLAFDTFSQSSCRLIEFDILVNKYAKSCNRAKLLDVILQTGILRVTSGISFTHKLYKEFFAAYHLFHKFPLSNNHSIYLKLLLRDDWKEVFIFASGMQTNIEDQDAFLDFIMDNHLGLYIECINAKSDLSIQLTTTINGEFASRYLGQLRKTYSFIIEKYFQLIKNNFDPTPGVDELDIDKKKIGIAGHISHNGEHLSYCFDRVIQDDEMVICLDESQLADYHKRFEMKAVTESRNIFFRGVNLKLSGLVGDSARKVAIDVIKSEIKKIIERKSLIEDKYVLVERLNEYKKKFKEIYNTNDLKEIYKFINEIIRKSPSSKIRKYMYNGIDLIQLLGLVHYLIDIHVDFENSSLPKENVGPSASTRYLWEFFTDDQKINRASRYFYFHQLSYTMMVETNFPNLTSNFPLYKDSPYKNVVYLLLEQNQANTSVFGPSLTYYHVASKNNDPCLPEIRIVDNREVLFDIHKIIFNEIAQSYERIGKAAHCLEFSQTGFLSIIRTHNHKENLPLSDYVYKSIKESLEDVLGDF